MSSIQVQPYLYFNGRFDEAFALYREALGAELEMRMTFDQNPDGPAHMQLPEGWGAKVMHASFRVGEHVLMASDGMSADAPAFAGFSLSLNYADRAAAERAFAALAQGGQVRMPLGPTFWAPLFGMVADRFGVSWMVGVQPAGAPA